MSTKTNLAHTIVKIFRAAQNFNFYPHEVNWEVAPINFWKAHRVFLRGQDGAGLALFAAVDHVEHFLLGETMMIGKTLGIDQLSALLDQTFFKTLRLGNPA